MECQKVCHFWHAYQEDLCNKFSVSRSSLQTLFKNNLNISPKKYINDLKLSKSKPKAYAWVGGISDKELLPVV